MESVSGTPKPDSILEVMAATSPPLLGDDAVASKNRQNCSQYSISMWNSNNQ
jgi:hypothetical protein